MVAESLRCITSILKEYEEALAYPGKGTEIDADPEEGREIAATGVRRSCCEVVYPLQCITTALGSFPRNLLCMLLHFPSIRWSCSHSVFCHCLRCHRQCHLIPLSSDVLDQTENQLQVKAFLVRSSQERKRSVPFPEAKFVAC